jgi:2-polyprenyl-3-methyl-5-hydroxy-6-metoxy-1,4-benzoquinol methylase
MSLHARYRDIPDEDWLRQLCAGADEGRWARLARRLLGTRRADPELPGFPDRDVQRQFVGSSGGAALREGFDFYRIVKGRCQELGRPIAADSRILDFGCGWGRILRFFLKDVPAENLCGVDVDPEMIRICRETVGHARFEAVDPGPPSRLPAGSFDVIYLYSVFSHLAEDVHLQWVEEFARLLRPGGLVFATTQKRSFIEYCNRLTGDQIVTAWHRSLARAFRPLEVALARYDGGEFVFTPTGGGGPRDASFYGEAAVSERYVDRHWPPALAKRSFDPDTLPQALIIAQKT